MAHLPCTSPRGGVGGRPVDKRRLERNAREQKRSLKISQRIDELRLLLRQSGISVKNSKSHVLQEGTNLIKLLLRQQGALEAERAHMLGLVQMLSAGGNTQGGARGGGGGGGADSQAQMQQAAAAAAQEKATAAATAAAAAASAAAASVGMDYQLIFHNAAIPLAVCSINGNIVECNSRMCVATGFRRDELLLLTVFNLVADAYLQRSFALISGALSAPAAAGAPPQHVDLPCKVRDGRPGGVLSVSLVRDDIMRPRFFAISMSPAPTTLL
ncbi:hypothetical protein JKP88DRAFT_166633 [Tribonema minus]|uniref:BHLH domain-containing protein n=1 Tax=Tribonema minus TaxID=303371 RepID=A0A835YRU1_9STRA|nr:hypothetical protein JKP88DRAFT_166633 [Tribonema minus]